MLAIGIDYVFSVQQVMQKFALEQGYEFTVNRQQRTVWKGYTPNNISDISGLRDELIESNNIDIGQKICPLRESKFVITDAGMLETKEQQIFARKQQLRRIRQQHLEEMDAAGILIRTDIDGLSKDQLQDKLTELKGRSPYC